MSNSSETSEKALGTPLMQNGQPVAFAKHALSKTEQPYAQIEKELLAFVFYVRGSANTSLVRKS